MSKNRKVDADRIFLGSLFFHDSNLGEGGKMEMLLYYREYLTKIFLFFALFLVVRGFDWFGGFVGFGGEIMIFFVKL